MEKKKENQLIYGKVPPQARELEEMILGAILLDKRAFEIASETLKPECFYVDANQIIFSAMFEMYKDGTPIDMQTMAYKLKSLGQIEVIGGPYYLMQLTNKIVGYTNTDTHCKIVLEKYIQREVIRLGSELIAEAYEDSADVFELAVRVDTVSAQIQNSLFHKDYSHISEAVLELSTRVEILKTQPSGLSGVDTGFDKLNQKTHGWQNTDLIIIAARPSIGKTAFALNLAKNAATTFKNKGGKIKCVGFFSLEMSKVQLAQRIVSNEGGIYMECLSTGRDINPHFYTKAMDQVSSLPIYIDDTATLNIMQLKAKARRMVTKDNVGLIIIDYLQLMSGHVKGGNREQEISSISRGLKVLAKELNIPVIALSQLSRQVEGRGKDAEPRLADLRESGAIEQDADIVAFLYEANGNGRLKVAKYRNGALGDIDYCKLNHLQRWVEIDNDVDMSESLPSGKWSALPKEENDDIF
jgi:replicative DNA helicase